jgi:hypothetical protein
MILFAVLLIVILGVLLPKPEMTMTTIMRSGTWTGEGGIYLLFVALLQVFSYPFHDPVMTDRAFIAPPRLTLRSFIAATIIGGLSIVLFSFIGIYGNFAGISGQAPVEVSKLLGPIMMLLVNFIMITSAASTLDSAFNSFSKLAIVDLKLFKSQSISNGRIMIIIACLLGTIPIFLNADILSATTISGTMVIGLTPIFAMWFLDAPKLSFYLSIFIGIVVGVLHVMNFNFPIFNFTGPYSDLLEANIWGVVLSFMGYFIPVVFFKFKLAR